ncbi:Deoxycytidine kinase-like protein [Drosera capensis]
MQKFLRRIPTGSTSNSNQLGRFASLSSFLGYPNRQFESQLQPRSPVMLRPLHGGAVLRGGGGGGVCRICRCNFDYNNGAKLNLRLSRPWVALKGGKSGSRVAWVHTVAGDFGPKAVANEGLVGLVNGEKGKENENGKENVKEKEKEEKDENDGGQAGMKVARLSGRRRGSGISGLLGLSVNPDLLKVPGVGPRNLRKLADKGIAGLDQLKQLYRDKFRGDSSTKMVEFLRSSVGIIHRNHAESITTFIKETVDEESKEEDSTLDVKPQKRRITFCVEGNISVGKTTFLQRIANETLELRDLVEIVPEPVNKWQDVGPNHCNILDAFYAEPKRYAYTFQNYVFVTRVMQGWESSNGVKPLRLMERSVFSDRMVFVRAVHEAKWMNEMEISIYDSWFDPVVSTLPGLVPDGFIYLRASPDTCHKRMMLRNRSEEGGVSLDYLRDLHEKHESWLYPFESGNQGVLSVSKPPLTHDSSLPPNISDRVCFLEGPHMHSSIQKIPALVLDCEPNIDFTRDIEAKEHYARQVAEFFAFVKKDKEVVTPRVGGGAEKDSYGHFSMPQVPGLWVPDGNRFPELPLNSLDFTRGMSHLSG